MMLSEYPPTPAQENFLCLLCFSKDSAGIVRGQIGIELFESNVYREIADQAIAYLDSYGEPIGQHLPDVFDHVLQGDDSRRAKLYRDTILHLKSLHDEGLNERYCLNQLQAFIRRQSLKQAIMSAAEAVQSDNVEEAESALDRYWRRETTSFDPGQWLSNTSQIASFLYNATETYPTGIPHLDRISFGLEPGTLLTFIAPTGRGKSWAMVHFGKQAALHRKKVLHISLEMSEEKAKARYVQAFLAIARREAEQEVIKFVTSKGDLSKLDVARVVRPTLRDAGIEEQIKSKAERIARHLNIVIKAFPTSSLTVKGLESYLDSLDRQYKWQPDVLLLDYIDLMAVSADRLRLDIGILFKEFRRICGERNLAGATPSQTNRLGEDARVVTLKHLAEDYSKAQTSDRILTYNQTAYEKQRGLARLYVAKNRDEEDKGMVIVSQNYHTGQFCLDSALMSSFYRERVLEKSSDAD